MASLVMQIPHQRCSVKQAELWKIYIFDTWEKMLFFKAVFVDQKSFRIHNIVFKYIPWLPFLKNFLEFFVVAELLSAMPV